MAGARPARPGHGWRADASETGRLWYATPKWNDCVLVAFSEIRSFGAGVMPVARRLRAVLLDLAALVSGPRRVALDAAVARAYAEGTEREDAMTPDRQGIGGSSGFTPPSAYTILFVLIVPAAIASRIIPAGVRPESGRADSGRVS